MKDSVVAAVRADLLLRSQLGIEKYGTTLDRSDLSERDWMQHAYEEMLDAALYLKKLILLKDTSGINTAPAQDSETALGSDHV